MSKILEFIVDEKNWYADNNNVMWHKDCGRVHLDGGKIKRYSCEDVIVYVEDSYKDKDGNLCTTIEFSIEKILECMTEKSKRKMFNLLKKEIGDDKNGI